MPLTSADFADRCALKFSGSASEADVKFASQVNQSRILT